VSRDEFGPVLRCSVERAFAGGEPSAREVSRYLSGLHLQDLALACACALGREAAWEHFVLEHRPVLYRSADAIDPTGGARELADSLYADLYRMSDAADRKSLFRYFHGRSSLGTWLRAVLSQRHVDAMRARRRIEPLPDDADADHHLARRPEPPSTDPDRRRLVHLVIAALRVAIEALAPRDRLRLRSYYVMQLTLAQIGRITGEHEATVSRQIAKTRRGLREALERHLREAEHLTGEQVTRAVELAIDDPEGLDLQQAFDVSERKETRLDRSK